MPRTKSEKECCSKFEGLPKITTGCENTPLKICLDKCSPEGQIRWYESNDGKHWKKVHCSKRKCLEIFPTLADDGKYYRAEIRDNCDCWISQKTQLQILPSSSLILDNGTVGNAIGNNPAFPPFEQFLWLNRFTPSSYPFILKEIQIYFASNVPADVCNGPTGITGTGGPTNVNIGDPVNLYIWANPGGYFNPAAGNVYLDSLTNQKVKKLDSFSSYVLPKPLIFEQGDVLIGSVNRVTTAPYFPASLQIACANSARRSWIGQGYNNGVVPNPPFLPAPEWSLIDDLTSNNFFAGNWLIRAIGCGGSQEPIQLNQAISSSEKPGPTKTGV